MNRARMIATLTLTWIATTPLIAQSTVITDPTQITSKQKFDIQPFTVDKLYMTRAIAG